MNAGRSQRAQKKKSTHGMRGEVAPVKAARPCTSQHGNSVKETDMKAKETDLEAKEPGMEAKEPCCAQYKSKC